MSRALAMATRLVVFLALLLLLSGPAALSPVSAVPCSTVDTKLTPCMSYVTGNQTTPSESCCGGVKEISGSIKTKQDKQSVCECIKKRLSGMKYDPARIPQLSKKCGASVTLPPINSSTNCAKIDVY